MGVSAWSYVVHGIPVKRSQIQIKKNVRNCTHETNLEAPFCSQCGKPVWKEQTEIVENLESNEHKGLSYFANSIYSYREDPDDVFILGFCVSYTSSYNCPVDKKIAPVNDEMKQDLQDFCARNNIEFNSNRVGLYHILDMG
jgi:hypothetical protein